MKPLLLCVAGCLLQGAAAGCNKNKHCSDDEFCYSTTSGGACSNKNCACEACDGFGQPGFGSSDENCDRYESRCTYACDGSDYPATAPAPTPRPTPQPQAAPAPTPRPTEGTSTGTGVSCSKNKHCEDGEFCKADGIADECFVCYYPGDLVPGSTACNRYENVCNGYACDGSDWDRYPTPRPSPRPTSRPTHSQRPTPRPSPRPTSRPTLRPTPMPTVSLRPTLRPTHSQRPTPRPSPRPTPTPTGSITGYVMTDSKIFTAKNAWLANPAAAEATYGHISTWDTSAVTNMENLFCAQYCWNSNSAAASFNEDIGAWDTSGVTSMTKTFYRASAFNQDLGEWAVHGITTNKGMQQMFYGASAFDQDLGWCVDDEVNINTAFVSTKCASTSCGVVQKDENGQCRMPTPRPQSAPTPRPQSAPTPRPQFASTPRPTPQPHAAPAPTPRPIPQPTRRPTPRPAPSPTAKVWSTGTGTGVSCSKNKHCGDEEFCNAEANECFVCYYPGDLDPDSTACDRYENACVGYGACDGSDVTGGGGQGDSGQGDSSTAGESAGGGVFKLLAADADTYDQFGISVGIDGATVVIGAYKAGVGGAVYVYRTTNGGVTYSQVAKLTAADAAMADYFGYSVAIDGNTIVVGAYGDGSGAVTAGEGSVYVFRTTNGVAYSQVAKFSATDTAYGDWFGYSVAIDGDTIVVGAPYKSSRTGAAYVFRTSDGGATYGQVAKLKANDGRVRDLFGWSVAIAGGTVVIGAYDAGTSGAAYVYRTTDGGATYVTKLTAGWGAYGDQFGRSVAIDGDTIVAGAPGDRGVGSNSGSVSVLQTTDGGATYDVVAKLTAPDAASYDYFGMSVAIAGGTVVVGAPDHNGESGAVYVYRGATYDQVAKLTASNGAPEDRFGTSVAVGGENVVVGAPGTIGGDYSDGSGVAYVFGEEELSGGAGAATASAGAIFGVIVAVAVAVLVARSALLRFRSQRRASERAAADAEDFKLEAALSDAADEMAVPEKQAAP